MLTQLLLAGIDTGINALLKLDPVSQSRLRALSGQVLAIQANQPDLPLYLLFQQDGLQLAAHWEAPADCTLRGSTAELWHLLTAHDKLAALYQPGISIEGNKDLLVNLSTILQDMNIDWEYQLQQWVGPVAAGLAGSHIRQRSQWAGDNIASLQQRLQDWLSEETRLLVGKNEAESYFAELDQLKLQLDRLDARTALIRRQLEPDT